MGYHRMKLLNYFQLSNYDYNRFLKIITNELYNEPIGSMSAVCINRTSDYLTILIFGDICFLAIYNRKTKSIEFCPEINFNINNIIDKFEKHIIFGHTSELTYYNKDLKDAWFKFISKSTAFISIIKELDIFEDAYNIYKQIPLEVIEINSKELLMPKILEIIRKEGTKDRNND